jgi:hypothetical protein
MSILWTNEQKRKFVEEAALQRDINFKAYTERVHHGDPDPDGTYDRHCFSCLVFIKKVSEDEEQERPTQEYCERCQPAVDQGYVVKLGRFE